MHAVAVCLVLVGFSVTSWCLKGPHSDGTILRGGQILKVHHRFILHHTAKQPLCNGTTKGGRRLSNIVWLVL